jgi:hypothetical protein
MATYLAGRLLEIAANPSRNSMIELVEIAAAVSRQERFLDTLVGDASEAARAETTRTRAGWLRVVS